MTRSLFPKPIVRKMPPTEEQTMAALLEENRILKEQVRRLSQANADQMQANLTLTATNKQLVGRAKWVEDSFVADRVALCADIVTTRLFNVCRLKDLQTQHPDIHPDIAFWDEKSEEHIQRNKKHPALQPEAVKMMPSSSQDLIHSFYVSQGSILSQHAASRDERHRIAHTIDAQMAAVMLIHHRHPSIGGDSSIFDHPTS